MSFIAGVILVFAICLLLTVPFAAVRHGKDMAASGVITGLIVGAVAVPFMVAGAVVA